MTVNVASFGDVQVVEIAGELNVSNVSALARAIEEELEAGSRKFVVDMSDVNYLDIHGLRGLNGSLKHVRRAGGDLCLAQPSDIALASLNASRLDEIFTIFETLQGAVNSF